MSIANDHRLERIDPFTVRVDGPEDLPITLLATDEVAVDRASVDQLLRFAQLQETVREVGETGYFGPVEGRLERLVVTPDFHKGGSGIPVGTVVQTRGMVIPQAVGNDICCGMRLMTTDLGRDDIASNLTTLEPTLRDIFFGGKREIPMSPRQREALLREGLLGLLETHEDNAADGLWRWFEPSAQEEALRWTHADGSLLSADTDDIFGDYVQASGGTSGRDSQIGSVGGGNHFVEVQVVDEILDGAIAHEWGVRQGQVTIMVHSGSVGLGRLVGRQFVELAKAAYPAQAKHPEHGFYALPLQGRHAELSQRYLQSLQNAANFAFGNRLCLGLMVIRALTETLGREVEHKLIHDIPHNLVWTDDTRALHRKGACPALGPVPDHAESPFQWTGHPVIIPGSMGTSSFLMAGLGKEELLCSACHGAGRILPRGKAQRTDDDTYRDSVEGLRVVTPIDPNSAQARMRRDVQARYHDRLKQEAPYAYKPIVPVIDTVVGAGVAKPVARLWPLLTIKG